MKKKHIKIFTSYDKEVDRDIAYFSDFLCILNSQNKDFEFTLFKNEKELCESLEHTQERIDHELNTCEYYLLILGHNSDEYIMNRLNQVIDRYDKVKGTPDIHIFINTGFKDSGKLISFFASDTRFEHYVEQYKHNDTLKAKFLVWFCARQKEFSYQVSLDKHGHPVITVGGHPVSSLVDFDALLNNQDYQAEKKKLLRRLEKREEYKTQLSTATGVIKEDILLNIKTQTKEIEEIEDRIRKLEKDTLAMYQNYAKLTLETGYNAKRKRALEYIEQGNFEEARVVLDPEGSITNLQNLVHSNEMLSEQLEINKDIALQEISILLTEINRLYVDTENPNRLKEIKYLFEQISYFKTELDLDISNLMTDVILIYKELSKLTTEHEISITEPEPEQVDTIEEKTSKPTGSKKQLIKIYTTFDKTVDEDIARFGDFLCLLNSQSPEHEFSIFKDEKELCERLEHPQEKITDELNSCEYFLLILGNTYDDYILQKLAKAIKLFNNGKKTPDIHIFVNNNHENANKITAFFASDEKFQHYVEQFKHNDTLKAKFLLWFSAKQQDFAYHVETDRHGVPAIKVGGRPVSWLVDYDALLNNEDYQDEKEKLLRKQVKRDEYRQKLINAKDEVRNELLDNIRIMTEEINDTTDLIQKLEKDTLSLYKNYAKKTLEDGFCERRKRALECIEKGDVVAAKDILDPEGSIKNLEGIVHKNTLLSSRKEVNKQIAKQEINILLAEIDRLNLDIKNPNRFIEIENIYDTIEQFQQKLGLEVDILYVYSLFLKYQVKYDKAIEKIQKNITRLEKKRNETTYYELNELGESHDELADLYMIKMSTNEAENERVKALNLRRDLLKNNDKLVYKIQTAQALNNLASSGNHTEAVVYLSEAFELLDNHKDESDDALHTYAETLHTFGAKLWSAKRYEDASKYIKEAIDIRKKLATYYPNEEKFQTDLADSQFRYAHLLKDTKRFDIAERYFEEALVTFKWLTEKYPDYSFPNTALTMTYIAEIQKSTGRYTQSEKNYKRAINYYTDQIDRNPDVYIMALSMAVNDYGDLLIITDNYSSLRDEYEEAFTLIENYKDDYEMKYNFAKAELLLGYSLIIELNDEGEDPEDEALDIHMAALEIIKNIQLQTGLSLKDRLIKHKFRELYMKEKMGKTEDVEDCKEWLKKYKVWE